MSLPLDKNFIPNKVAAEVSGYNSDYIARLCREGKIEGTQIGRAWFVNRESLEKFIKQQDERKKELARELSVAREREYKAHHPGETVPAEVKKPVQEPVIVKAPLIPSPITVRPVHAIRSTARSNGVVGPRLSEVHPALRQGFALSLTILVLVGSVAAANSGIVNRIAATLIASAVATQGGEQELPEKTVLAIYRLGDALAYTASSVVVGAPTAYRSGVLALVSTPSDKAAAVATIAKAPEQGIGPRIALTTYRSITSFFNGAVDRLAIFFGFKQDRFAVLPFDAASTLHPSTNLPTPTISSEGVTYRQGITTVNYLTGVSASYVDSYVASYVTNALRGLRQQVGADVLDSSAVTRIGRSSRSSGSVTFSGGALTASSLTVTGAASVAGTLTLGGITGSTQCLHVDSAGVVSGTGSDCGAGGGGITSIGAQYSTAQTGATQTFATSSDTNIQLTITSSGDTHTFTPVWTGVLSVARGGTGLSSVTANQLLIGNSSGTGYTSVATSSLGLSTSDINEGSNLYYTLSRFASALAGTTTDALAEGLLNKYYTDARARNAFSATATGLSYATTTGVLSLTSGYEIPLSASTSNWNSFFDTPSTRITAGTNLSWAGNTLNGPSDSFIRGLLAATAPLSYDNTTGTFSIATATATTSGFLTSTDWTTFNNKFATTSTNYWLSTKSTTDLAEGTNLYYTDARVNAYVNGSSTITKAYSTNTFTGNNIFNGGITIGSLNGPLQANNGVVSATSSVGVLYGGTGLTSAPSYGDLLVGNVSGGYTLTATSSLGLEAALTFSSPLTRTGNTVSMLQSSASQDGYLSASDWLTFNNKFATTSTNYWLSTKSTTDLTEGSNLYYTDARVATYINGSSTIPHVGGSAFGDLLLWDGSSWINRATSTLALAISDTTGTLDQSRGGTGITSYSAGDLLYADGGGALTKLPIGTAGQVLKVTGGLPQWGVDLTTGGGGGAGAWSTTTDSLAIYPTDTSNVVIIGNSATSTLTSIFEVHGRSYFSNSVTVGTTTGYSKLSVWSGGTGTGQAFEVTNNASTTLAKILDNGTAYFAGSVGIASTSPSFPLSVTGNAYVSGTITTTEVNSPSGSLTLRGATGSGLTFVTNGSGTRFTISATGNFQASSGVGFFATPSASSATTPAFGPDRSDTTTGIGSSAAGTLSFITSGTTKLQLANGGNLGLGSTTPFAKLSVHANNGDTNTSLFSIASSTANSTTTLFSVNNIGSTTLYQLPSSILKTNANGTIVAATAGTDYLTSSTGVTSIAQAFGSAQTGAITFATSTNGMVGFVIGLNITNSSGAFTFTPSYSGTLAIANGGTGTSTQVTNGVNYYDGTRITSNSTFTFSGTTGQLSIPTNGWLATGGNLFAYASSTNGATIFGRNAGGTNATTSATVRGTTAIGYQALTALGTGNDNTALGYQTLTTATSSSDNTAIGYQALKGAGTAQFGLGFGGNTAVGSQALTANTTGYWNSALGYQALVQNTTGNQNTAVGTGALSANTTGYLNVALGTSAGYDIISGIGNIAIGDNSAAGTGGQYNIVIGSNNAATSSGNTIVGTFAGVLGAYNTVFGYRGGVANGTGFTGYGNILIGANVDQTNNITSGANNIGIGYNTIFPSGTANNQLNIANFIYGTIPATTTAFAAPTTGALGIASTSPFAKLSIHANNGSTATSLFAIGSSTASATTTLFSVSNTGVITSNASATSTFAQGIAVAAGCVSVNGTCLGIGSVTSVDASGGTTGLSFTGGPITSSGTLTLSGTLAIANGGTGTTTQITNGINYYDGTRITSNSNFTFNGTTGQLVIPGSGSIAMATTSNRTIFLVYASSTNKATTLGLGAGGQNATTSSTQRYITAIGYNALNAAGGSENVGVGAFTLAANRSGNYNTALGTGALQYNAFGDSNVAIGDRTLESFNGTSTIAIGRLAGNGGGYDTGSKGSVYIGDNVGSELFDGSDYNVVIGYHAGGTLSTGYGNIIIGPNIGSTMRLTTGANNIGIGYNVAFPSNADNQFNIGNFLYGTLPATTTNFALPTAGALGVASTSPWATLSLHANNGSTNTTLFAIGSSTASATSTLFSVNNIGSTTLFRIPSTVLTTDANGTIIGTSSVGVTYGGTGLSTAPSYGQLLVGNSTGGYTLTATSSLGFGTGSVTSVDASGGTTGLSFSGGPITSSGTLTLAGTLNVANGGTGSTTLSGILKGNGTGAVQTAVAGTDYQAPITAGTGLSFSGNTLNSYWTLDGSNNLYNNNTSGKVGIGTSTPTYTLDVGGYINTDSNFGYKQGGRTILYASSTARATLVGVNAGAALTTGTSFVTAVGYGALQSLTTAAHNTAVGYTALSSNTDGTQNTALGSSALASNISGSHNVALGYAAGYFGELTDSVTIGAEAGVSAAPYTAQGGVTIGYHAGYNYADGSDFNTLLGYQAGLAVTSGAHNIVIGADSSGSNSNLSTGSNNIQIGYNLSLPDGTASNQLNIGNLLYGTGLDGTGSTVSTGNLGVGTTTPGAKLSVAGDTYSSGFFNTSGTSGGYKIDNTLVLQASSTNGSLLLGFSAGPSLNSTSAAGNIGVGYQTLLTATSSLWNVALGYQALAGVVDNTNGTGSTDSGSQNVAIGYQALTASNMSGVRNTAIGYQALQSNTSGENNQAIGYKTLASNTSGDGNIAIGIFSLTANTTGQSNVSVGQNTMSSNITGQQNVAVGHLALRYNLSATTSVAVGYDSGSGNGNTYNNQGGTYIGYQAGQKAATSSDYNTFLGYRAGFNVTTGYGNILVGASPNTSGGSNLTTGSGNIGIAYNPYFASGSATNQLNIGNFLFGTLPATTTTSALARFPTTGTLGVGTSSPYAKLSIGANNGDTTTTLFAIGSSTATATSTLFSVNNIGSTTLFRLTSQVLKTDANGTIVGAIAGTDYLAGGTGAATTTLSYSGPFTTNATPVVFGSSPITITYTGLATTTSLSSSQLLVSNGGAGVYGVSTSTATLGLGLSGSLTALGGSNSLSIATSSLYTGTQGQIPYFSGTNSLIGTSTLFLTTNSFVGVGSTTPWGKLSIDASGLGTAPSFAIGSSSATSFVVTNGGLVGVGTSSPFAALSIKGPAGTSATQVAPALAVYGGSGYVPLDGTGGTGAGIIFVTGNGGNAAGSGLTDGAGGNFSVTTGNGGSFGFNNGNGGNISLTTGAGGSGTNGVITFGIGGVEKARFGTSGNLGLGSTSPFAKLSVHANNGDTNTSLFSIASSTSNSTSTLFAVNNVGSTTLFRLTSQVLKTDANGTIVGAIAGTDYLTSSTGVTSIQQTGGGTAQTGAITLATSSTSTTGLTLGLNITNSSGAFTFTPSLSGTLAIANGGTNATSQTTNGVAYYNGSSLTTQSTFTFSGTSGQLSIPTNGWLATGGNLFAYASSTNGATIFGTNAGGTNATTSATQRGTTAIGYQALTALVNGTSNTALGFQTLTTASSSSNNTAVGYQALKGGLSGSVTFGSQNTAVGASALQTSTSGSDNVALGYNTLSKSTTGSGNVVIGSGAFINSTAANYNIGIGINVGTNVDTGYGNILLGANVNSVTNTTSGGNNIGIGYNTLFPSATANNQLNIGGLLFGTLPATSTATTLQLPTTGALGIASSSPFASFALHANNGSTATTLFAIGSSTASATTTLLSVANTGVLSVTATATSTFSSGLNVAALNITGSATSTAANGFNIAAGCYAVNGTCLTNFSNTLANGGTATTTFYSGGVVYSDGTKLTQAAGTGNKQFVWDDANGRLGLGTSTPFAQLSLSPNGITGPALFVGSSTGVSTGVRSFVTVSNAGQLSVGSTTPGAALSVYSSNGISGSRNAPPALLVYGGTGYSPGSGTAGNGADIGLFAGAGGGTISGTGGSGGNVYISAGDVGIDVTGTARQGNVVFNINPADTSTVLGHVGVASTSPYAALSIQGVFNNSNRNTTLFAIGSSTSATTTTLFTVSNVGVVGLGTTSPWATLAVNPVAGQAANAFVVGSSTGTQLVVTNSGNVGIGTSTPGSLLSVGGATYISGNVTVGNTSGGTVTIGTGFTGTLNIGDGTVSKASGDYFLWNTGIRLNTSLGKSIVFGGSSLAGTDYSIKSDAGLNFYVNSTNSLLNLTSGGNVGVGTTSPFAKFSIHAPNGDTNTTLFAIGSSTAGTTDTLFTISNEGIIDVNPGTSTFLTLYGTPFLAGDGSNLGLGDTDISGAGIENISFGNGSYIANSSNYGIAIGSGAGADFGHYHIALGYNSYASGAGRNIAIGPSAQTYNGDSIISIGYQSNIYTSGSIGIGTNAYIEGGASSTAIGADAAAYGTLSTVLGAKSYAVGSRNIIVGENSLINRSFGGSFADENIILGSNAGSASLTGFGNLFLGNNTYGTSTTASRFLNIGGLVFGTLPATTTAFALPTTGAIGIASSSPYAKFSIQANNGSSATTLFAIGSSTASATTTLLSVANTGVLTSTANATSTFSSGLNVAALNITGTATSTAANGINLTAGCFSVNGACIGGGSFSNTLAGGGTATTTFYAGGVVYSDGTKLTQASGSGAKIFAWDNSNGRLGLGTTTPSAQFSLDGASYTGTSLLQILGGTAPASAPALQNGAGISLIAQSANNLNGTNGGSIVITAGTGSLLNSGNGGDITLTAGTADVSGNAGILTLNPGAAGANRKVLIASTGGVAGVGTTSPFAKLSIHANNGETNKSLFAIGSSTASATSTLFTVLNTGAVGIGTSSPYAKLSVVGQIVADNIWATSSASNYFAGAVGIGTSSPFAYTGIASTNYARTLYLRNTNVGLGTASDVTVFEATSLQSFDSATGRNLYGVRSTPTSNGDGEFTFNPENNYAFYGAPSGGTNDWGIYLTGEDKNYFSGKVGVGSTSPYAKLSIHANNGSTDTTLFAIGSSTAAATTTLFSVSNIGVLTSTASATSTFSSGLNVAALNITGSATSTAANGINLTGGCFAVNGTCISAGGGSGTVNSGTIGQFPYYAANGTTLTATSSLFLATNQFVGVGSTTPWGKLSIDTGNLGSSPAFVVGSSTATSFLVTNGGKVGIGTTSPYSPLHISYDATTTNSSNPILALGTSSFSSLSANGTYLGIQSAQGFNGNFLDFRLGGFNGSRFSVSTTTLSLVSGIDTSISIQGNDIVSTQMFSIHTKDNSSLYGGDLKLYAGNGYAFGSTDGNNVYVYGGTAASGGSDGNVILAHSGTAGVGNVGIGTTSPYAKLSVAGNVVAARYIATTTATSTFAGGLDVLALNLTGSATSTAANGINLTGGCFAVNGTCISAGGGSGTVNSGTTGQLPYYAADGTTLTATSSLFLATNQFVGVGSTTPWGKLSIDTGNLGSSPAFVVGSSTATSFLVTNGGRVAVGSTSPANYAFSVTGTSYLSGSTIVAGAFRFYTGASDGNNDYTDLRTNPASGNGILSAKSGALFLNYDHGSDGTFFSDGNQHSFAYMSSGGRLVVGAPSDLGAVAFTPTNSFEDRGNASIGYSSKAAPTNGLIVNGTTGIGTTSPYAKLSIHANNGDTNGTLFAIGSSTANSTTTLFKVSNTGALTQAGGATSTFSNGIDISTGCFSINGSCVGAGSFTNTLANGGTATTTFYNGGLVFSDGSKLTQAAGSGVSQLFWDNTNGRLGIGTSSPQRILHIANSGANNQLLLEDTGASANQHYGSFGFSRGAFSINTLNDSLASTTRFVIDSSGLTGIGTSTPSAKLSVTGNGTGTGRLFALADSSNVERLTFLDNGKLGIGTTSPNWLLSVSGTTGTRFKTTSDIASAFVVENSVGSSTLQVDTLDSSSGIFSVATSTGSTYFYIGASGNIGVGTTTPGAAVDVYNGALCVDDSSPTCQNAARTAGTIYAVSTSITGIDLAERYPTKDASLVAGEIVAFDPANQVFVKRAEGAATSFLGVVSTKPGIELGGYNEELYKDEKKVPIALAGRVPVKVNMEGGAIAVGDYITISSTAGVGKKATASGQTIGVALEAASGTATIQVYIKPEYTFVASQFAIDPSTGNVGIGVEHPTHKLEVAGDAYVNGLVSGSAFTAFGTGTSTLPNLATNAFALGSQYVTSLAGPGLELSGGVLSIATTSLTGNLFANGGNAFGTTTVIGTRDSQDLSFMTASTTRLTITADGKIGIGTTSPNHTVEVVGDIAAISFVNTSTRTAKKDINYLTATTTEDILAAIENLKIAQYHYKIESSSDPMRLGLIAEEAPEEVLSLDGKGVDIYKLATFTLAGIQALSGKVTALEQKVADIDARLQQLSSVTINVATDTPSVGSGSGLAGAFEAFGAIIQNGLAQFKTLVAREFVASHDADGTSSAGTGHILAGNTMVIVSNKLVHSSSKIFLTWNGPVQGGWYISEKKEGSFQVNLSAPTTADVEFDYFIIQTEGQVAAAGEAGGDTVPPEVTLSGATPIYVPVGGVYAEPGATAVDAVDGPVEVSLQVNGQTVDIHAPLDTSHEATYTLTYVAFDKKGNYASKSRTVIVANPGGEATPAPTPTPAPAPTPEPAPEPAPAPTPTPAPAPTPEPAPTPTPTPTATPEPAPEPAPAPTPQAPVAADTPSTPATGS